MANETFEDRHKRVNGDALVELMRRQQPWASAPPSNGVALDPSACIVPDSTVRDAITEISEMRSGGVTVSGYLLGLFLASISGAIVGAGFAYMIWG